jgi:hypothetical protein
MAKAGRKPARQQKKGMPHAGVKRTKKGEAANDN